MSAKISALIELIKHEHQTRIENAKRDYSYFHPSEFHQCVRKLAYQYYGAEKKITIKPDTQRIFDNGHYMHVRFGKYFENIGVLHGNWKCNNPLCGNTFGFSEKLGITKPTICDKCQNTGFEYIEKQVENTEYMMRGHVDAILKIAGDMVVADYKSMHSNQFTRLSEPLDKHIIQIEIYLWLLGLNSGILLYENKDNQKIKMFEVVYNQTLIDKILRRASSLIEIIKSKKLPKRPFERDSSQCKACEFVTTCWKKV